MLLYAAQLLVHLLQMSCLRIIGCLRAQPGLPRRPRPWGQAQRLAFVGAPAAKKWCLCRVPYKVARRRRKILLNYTSLVHENLTECVKRGPCAIGNESGRRAHFKINDIKSLIKASIKYDIIPKTFLSLFSPPFSSSSPPLAAPASAAPNAQPITRYRPTLHFYFWIRPFV